MIKDRKWINVFCVVLLAAVMLYLFQDVFKTNSNKYETEVAEEVTVQEKVNLQAFIVRDERYIDSGASGTVVSVVSDGDRVASGDTVARVCTSEQDAADFAELEEAKKLRERYSRLSGQTELDALDMEKLNKNIDEAYTDFLETAGSRNYKGLNACINELEDSLASKQVLMNGGIDISSKISALDKRIAELEAKKISAKDIPAPLSGYYISNIDGYEEAVGYKDLSKLNVSMVNKALDYSAKTVDDKMGKIVASYKWYIIANIDSKYSKLLEKGESLKVNIPEYGFKDVPVVVEYMSAESGGKIAVGISCNVMNETYANIRIENIELVIAEHTGYRVKTNAIHTYDPEKETTTLRDGDEAQTTQKPEIITVVYILRGNVMNARRVEILYTDGEYSIVKNDTKSSQGIKPIQRYDEVIVKGRNLKNGRSIG